MDIQVLKNSPYTEKFETSICSFPFELDPFQKHAHDAILNNRDVIVCAATSLGKTTVCKIALLYAIKTDPTKRAALTVPVKALADDIYENFKKDFLEYGITVGILTGDKKIDIDSQVVILTAEILRNTLVNGLDENQYTDTMKERKTLVQSLKTVVIDEIHYLNDPDRGTVWEETLMTLPKSVQLVGLSATINDPEDFVRWLYIQRKVPLTLIIADKRIIPLRHYVYVPLIDEKDDKENLKGKLVQLMDSNGVYSSNNFVKAKNDYLKYFKRREAQHKSRFDGKLINEVTQYMQVKELLPAIFFSYSRSSCEDRYPPLVHVDLIDYRERSEIEKIFDSYMRPILPLCKNSSSVSKLRDLLVKGIAYHHSGMMPCLKSVVQLLFSKKLIKVLFATETLSVGVNMPTRTVVFLELEKYTDNGVKRFLTPAEYKQAAGRAGRRGMDIAGDAIILPIFGEFPEEGNVKKVLTGSMPAIKSKFQFNYRLYLNVKGYDNIVDFVSKSILEKEFYKDIQSYEEETKKLQESVEDITITEDMLKLYELETKSVSMDFGIKISLDKKKLKEQEKLKKTVCQKDYEVFLKNKETERKISLNRQRVEDCKNYIRDTYTKIQENLFNMGFVDNIKGVIASQVNMCNPLLLSECMINNFLEGLTPVEIVVVLSIFCNPIKKSEELCELPEDKELKESVSRIIKISEKRKWLMGHELNDPGLYCSWDITYDYVEIVYNWALGMEVSDLLTQYGEQEGNFVKNILKLEELVQEVINICKLIHNFELVPVLEKIESLIIRDIVLVNNF